MDSPFLNALLNSNLTCNMRALSNPFLFVLFCICPCYKAGVPNTNQTTKGKSTDDFSTETRATTFPSTLTSNIS